MTGVAIVGAAETDDIGWLPNHSSLRLNVEAAVNALRDCDIGIEEIDGIAGIHNYPNEVAHELGITPTWVDNTTVGGCSAFFHVRHAAAAIATGMATTVLVTHGESGRSRTDHPRRVIETFSPQGQWEAPYGVLSMYSLLGLPVLRFLQETGTTHEQLASVPVAQRRWANRTPRALHRDLITIDDVFASPLMAYPLHRLQCCVVTDGGGAIVLTSAERAADRPKVPVHVLGTGEATDHTIISQMADFSTSAACRRSSSAAFAQAGLGPDDVQHLMVYDAFAHLPLFGLEDAGFVGRGEAGAFVAEGNTSPGGRLPMNTNGGGLSYTHTGIYGMFALLESVRQIRGEAAAQVADVEVGFAQGFGGVFRASGSLVLGRHPN